ncbi:MAG: hypothetical protein LBC02_00270, partial [Planctomycetaceae bacterium]|nr:hypothetical protein [Planctomycetaceae bacterium]
MKKLFTFFVFMIFACCSNFGYGEQPKPYIISFPESVKSKETDAIIDRIKMFDSLVQKDDFESLESVWFNKHINLAFDGSFNLTVCEIEYTSQMKPYIPMDIEKFKKEYPFRSVCFVHWAGTHPLAKDDKQYTLAAMGQNTVFVTYSDNKLSSYYEFGATINQMLNVSFSLDHGTPQSLLDVPVPEKNIPDDKVLKIDWKASKYGENIQQKDILLLAKMPSLPVVELADDGKKVKKISWGKTFQIPDCGKDKKLKDIFDRITQVLSAQKKDEMFDLFSLPLIKSGKHKFGTISFDQWRCQCGYFVNQVNEKNSWSRLYGYAFAKTKDGKLKKYLEGAIRLPVWFHDSPVLDEKGIEIIFHPNGYPASYSTIVKKRLFGRQIEWNDKGEIISDINLDIP